MKRRRIFAAAGCALLATSCAASSPPPRIAPPPKFAPPQAGAGLPSPLEAEWQGVRPCERLYENAAVRALRCTFPPGVGHERHFHAPHWGYALAGGTSRITTAEGVREVTTPMGSSYWSDGIAWHEVLNIGAATQIYLIIEPKAATPNMATPK